MIQNMLILNLLHSVKDTDSHCNSGFFSLPAYWDPVLELTVSKQRFWQLPEEGFQQTADHI